MRDFTKLIENIPDYKEFLTVDEMDANTLKLAEEFPEIVEVFKAGESRKGCPIYCMKIGDGSKNAFMFGCPHPNEPMGCMLLEYFSRYLCENEDFREDMDYTWYIIKSIDVDGTKLNEKWFKGPFTLSNYARNYFRPAGYEQAEWTFPMQYKNYTFDKPIPETQVLMKIIDEVKPTFMYSLHNAGFGGTYWYLTHDIPELWDSFYNVSKKQNIPIHLGEPEINYIVPYAPAIYPMIDLTEEYDYYEEFADEAPETLLNYGTSSGGYARKYGTTTLLTELPYFFEERIQSDKEMPFTRREAALKKIDFYHDSSVSVGKYFHQIESLISEDNPFSKMVVLNLKYNEGNGNEISKAFINSSEDYAVPCKESEAFDNLDLPKFFSLFTWALTIRACEFELEKDHTEEQKGLLRKIHAECEKEFAQRAKVAERDINYEVTPIKKLVSIQLECGMILADYLNPKTK